MVPRVGLKEGKGTDICTYQFIFLLPELCLLPDMGRTSARELVEYSKGTRPL